jgi:hypothetical protein
MEIPVEVRCPFLIIVLSSWRFTFASDLPDSRWMAEVNPAEPPPTSRCGMAEAEDGFPVPPEAMAGWI